ncbi:cupin domain-containing protein (plasmid) [Rhodococcus opacus]|uniref:cupin domain-containing protein n=1 Tax=Rhodococcus opacus TaxID=37919 RepID=UPI00146B85CB|nr:cupin domain-containing protein [Rhodococcus opacus]
MSDSVKTIVTHINADGSSGMEKRVVGRVTTMDDSGKPTHALNLLWGTKDGIATVGHSQPDTIVEPFFPGPGGHRFVIYTVLPETVPSDSADECVELPGLLDAYDETRSGMHASDSIDYTFVVSGEIVLELDDDEVVLRPGDCVVQRGTRHAWRNRTDEPAVVAAVLIGAERES